MSRTSRTKCPQLYLGDQSYKLYKNGKVRDGTFTRYAGSCENHGGCPYCESNRFHSTHKRMPIEDEL